MIAVVGSNTVDYFSSIKRLPNPGETMYGEDMLISSGGKGANQAAAAAKLGADVRYLSTVGGEDRYVDLILNGLTDAGVDVSGVESIPGIYCGAGYVMINTETANNSIIILKGANAHITPEYVERHRDTIINAKICMVEYMIPVDTAEYVINLAKKHGVTTMVNPAPAAPTSDAFYKTMDFVTPNEVEAKDLTGIEVVDEASAAEAAAFFHGKGVRNVVITLGGRGVFVSDGSRKELIPSYKVNAIDTSGAGDAFNGGLAFGLESGKNLFDAARFANAVAAVSVTRRGTMASMPSLEDALAQYNKPF